MTTTELINKITCGDCIEIMKKIDNKSIDLIICDLPYGITANEWDNKIDLIDLWTHYQRIAKDSCPILLFCSGIFCFELYNSNPKLWKYDLVWKKSKCGSPLTAKFMPLKKHEMVYVFGKSNTTYNPQIVKGEPYSRKWTPNKKNNMKYGIEGVTTNNKGTRHPITILDFKQNWRRQDQLHPTQKPLELMKWLVKSYSNEGDIVLDNCAGSGSTCVAAELENRRWIGIELCQEYVDIAIDRIKILRERKEQKRKKEEKLSKYF